MGGINYSDGWGKIDESPEDEAKVVESTEKKEETNVSESLPENEITE